MQSAVKNKDFWNYAKTQNETGEKARGINVRSENKKPVRVAGDLCKCLVCGYVGSMLTKTHTEKHGFVNQRAMIDAGKARYV